MTDTAQNLRLRNLTVKKVGIDKVLKTNDGTPSVTTTSLVTVGQIHVASIDSEGNCILKGSVKLPNWNKDNVNTEEFIEKLASCLYPSIEEIHKKSLAVLLLPTMKQVDDIKTLPSESIVFVNILENKRTRTNLVLTTDKEMGYILFLFKYSLIAGSIFLIAFIYYTQIYQKTSLFSKLIGAAIIAFAALFLSYCNRKTSLLSSPHKLATIEPFPSSPIAVANLAAAAQLDIKKLIKDYVSTITELEGNECENKRNLWSEPLGSDFFVRGSTYLVDRIKVPSESVAYKMLGLDLLLSTERVHHIAQNYKKSLVNHLITSTTVDSRPFLLIINFILPFGNFVGYFTSRNSTPFIGDPRFDEMMYKFIEGSDEYRNSRLKIIPKVVDGAWIVKKSIGTTPAIIGKKIPISYYKGENYLEVDIDICQNAIARSICSLVKSQVEGLIIDLAFVLEGISTQQLPERVVAALRFIRLDLDKAVPLEKE